MVGGRSPAYMTNAQAAIAATVTPFLLDQGRQHHR